MTDDLDFMAPNGAAIADLGYELAYVVLKELARRHAITKAGLRVVAVRGATHHVQTPFEKAEAVVLRTAAAKRAMEILKRACEASDRKRPQKRPPYFRAISLAWALNMKRRAHGPQHPREELAKALLNRPSSAISMKIGGRRGDACMVSMSRDLLRYL
jgi:hypothetical protein